MAPRFRTLHLALASSIALALVVCAYLFSGPFSFKPSTVDAATAEALLKSYATKDSDSDGLPDWQEALYGTDPTNPQSAKVGVQDGDAVAQGLVAPRFASATTTPDVGNVPGIDVAPATLTEQFSRELFSQYLTARVNSKPTPDEVTAFVSSKIDTLVATRYPVAYTANKVHKGTASGVAALSTYAASAQRAIESNTLNTDKTELDYFELLVKRNDTDAAKKLASISAMYTASSKSLMAMTVPPEAVTAHLALANAFAHMGGAVSDMGALGTDPVRGLVGITEYPKFALELTQALVAMNIVFTTVGLDIQEGQPGFYLYQLAKYAAAP